MTHAGDTALLLAPGVIVARFASGPGPRSNRSFQPKQRNRNHEHDIH